MLLVLVEIAVLLVLALLLGLFIGWLLWGQRRPVDDVVAPPKVESVKAPSKSILDLNKIENPPVKPKPESKEPAPKEPVLAKPEPKTGDRIVELGRSGGLLDES